MRRIGAVVAAGWGCLLAVFTWLTGLLRVLLVVLAVAFWLPVVDRANGLSDAARTVYLFRTRRSVRSAKAHDTHTGPP